MRELIANYGSWALSAATLYFTALVGRKVKHAFLIGLGAQAMWLVWIWATKQAGFLPLSVALVALYVHNHLVWNKRIDAPPVEELGWVIADAQELRFRRWGDSGPEWTADINKALHFSRRFPDAEEFCAEDEDAWKIIRHAYRPCAAEIEMRRITAGR
jgi:hypothetical protein